MRKRQPRATAAGVQFNRCKLYLWRPGSFKSSRTRTVSRRVSSCPSNSGAKSNPSAKRHTCLGLKRCGTVCWLPRNARTESHSRRPLRSLEFDSAAFEDLAWWVERDRAQALRLIRMIRETQRDPFSGIGKPEPLKHELSGCWSRRIDRDHRLVYEVQPEKIRILACRYHY